MPCQRFAIDLKALRARRGTSSICDAFEYGVQHDCEVHRESGSNVRDTYRDLDALTSIIPR